MKNNQQLKEMVRQKYSQIALREETGCKSSCCGPTNDDNEVYNIMNDDYTKVEGYQPDADLGLGCGLPTAFAQIDPGDTVIDLGSGAGNDCFIAAKLTGKQGKVIGIDFSLAMIEKAKLNARKISADNIEFLPGDIENIPVASDSADVIVSNCVLNLVPDKARVLEEIFRVLKPGGHFCISDIVLMGNLPEAIQRAAEMYAGCVSGAIRKETYLGMIDKIGFTDIAVQKEKSIVVPDHILDRYMDQTAIAEFRKSDCGIFSITVFARKPGSANQDNGRAAHG